MLVALLTIEQKNTLIGHHYEEASYFNPIQQIGGEWVISTQEVDNCNNPDFDWVKQLPLIEFTGWLPVVSGLTENI